MANGKIYWFGWATPKGWSGKWRSDSDTPYEAAEHYFPTGSDPIAAIRAAAEACSAAGGGTVYVGCDYPDDGDAFEIDYRAPADSHRLLLKNLNNVVIDFGGATLRQVNFTRLVLATDGAVIDPYADPPEGTPAIGTDGRWIAVGHPLVRVQNCRNVRIENLVLDGNRRDANPSSWGTEAPGTAPNCDTQQSPDHGVHIVGGEDIVLSNVRVVEAKMDGFQTHFATESGNGFSPYDPVRRVTFEDCSAVSCGRIGFGGDWGHEIKLVRCYAAESGMDFVSESVTRKATWTGPSDGVHFEAWEVEAIEKPGHRQLSVEGCTLERNGGRGLVVSGHEFPDGLFVSNCLFDDNGRRTVFSDVTRSFSHLEIAGAGATVANNTFRRV